MTVNVSINADGISKAAVWAAAITGQIGYASSRALNDVAKAAVVDLNQSTSTYFDRPTSFTTRGYYVAQYSNKRDLRGLYVVLDLRPIQARYLTPSIVGGTRPQRPSERKAQNLDAWRPGRDARLNTSGNISKAEAVRALKGGPKYFRLDQRRGKLPAGVYRRLAGGKYVQNILLFNALPVIPKRWPINRIAAESANKNWPVSFSHWIKESMRT